MRRLIEEAKQEVQGPGAKIESRGMYTEPQDFGYQHFGYSNDYEYPLHECPAYDSFDYEHSRYNSHQEEYDDYSYSNSYEENYNHFGFDDATPRQQGRDWEEEEEERDMLEAQNTEMEELTSSISNMQKQMEQMATRMEALQATFPTPVANNEEPRFETLENTAWNPIQPESMLTGEEEEWDANPIQCEHEIITYDEEAQVLQQDELNEQLAEEEESSQPSDIEAAGSSDPETDVDAYEEDDESDLEILSKDDDVKIKSVVEPSLVENIEFPVIEEIPPALEKNEEFEELKSTVMEDPIEEPPPSCQPLIILSHIEFVLPHEKDEEKIDWDAYFDKAFPAVHESLRCTWQRLPPKVHHPPVVYECAEAYSARMKAFHSLVQPSLKKSS